MAKTGGCRCGAVRYTVEGEPEHATLCWCTECRRSAGAPMVLWTLFAQYQLHIEGVVTDYESSPGTTRQFCPKCGTGLFYRNEEIFPGKVDVQGATFDDADAFAPTAQIQLADAPAWHAATAAVPGFERYPG